MKAVLRSYSCSESEDSSTYEEHEAADFGFTLVFAIGLEGSEGEEFFEVLVASATYLARLKAAREPAFLRHVILAPDYNIPAAVALVRKYIDSLDEDTWEKIVAKLRCVLRWEFEDYERG